MEFPFRIGQCDRISFIIRKKGQKNMLLTDIVHLADTIVLDIGFGIDVEQMKYPTNKSVQKNLAINSEFMAFSTQSNYGNYERRIWSYE